jgi:hypothetical protein
VSDIFLSYARGDRPTAERLAEIFRGNFWTVWTDSSLQAGEYWDDKIAAALREAKCVVVLWSEASVQSHWVRSEAEEARQRGVLAPARIDKVSLPYGYARLHTADLSDWRGSEQHGGLSELIAGVARILGGESEPGSSRMGRRRIAWWVYAALISVLVVAFVLLNHLRRDWTAVGLDVLASSVSFTAARDSTLFDLLVVPEISAVGIESLEIPRTTAAPARTLAKVAEPGVVRLLSDEASRDGSITFAPMPLPAGARASVVAGEREREFRIRIDRNVPVTVNVTGRVKLAVRGRQPESLDFGFPKPMVLLGGSGTDIAIRTIARVENMLAASIPVTSLGLTRIEERVAGKHLSVREISTVESGTLRIDSTTQGLPLMKGNKLLLTEPRGSIVRFEIGNDRIGIRFEGNVRHVDLCADEVCKDLSITVAEWLWRQHGAGSLAAGAAGLMLVGLLMRVWTRV